MAESFPKDIIKIILLRLPAKSLMRFKCVCKGWRSLISDPGFVKSHLQRLKSGDLIPSQRIIIGQGLLDTYRMNDYSFATIGCEALDGSEGGAVLPNMIIRCLKVSIAGSCDGLVCFLESDKFLIYNPTTGEHSEFPRSVLPKERDLLFHGFGYDFQSDDYKIVEGIVVDEDWVAEIFSLKSRSRRRILLDFNDENHQDFSGKMGVYWNGSLHWYVYGSTRDVIMSFDLSEEKFHQKLSVPEDFPEVDVYGYRVCGGLEIHGASLFIYSSARDTCIEAWITDEYERGGLWTKLFSVDCIPASLNFPRAYTRSGKILFQKDRDRVILFNPEDNTYKDYSPCLSEYFSRRKDVFVYCAIYLETLISPYLGSEPSRI